MKSNFCPSRSGADELRPGWSRRVGGWCAFALFTLASLASAQDARLVNLSVRTKLAAGDTLIAGFIITGSEQVSVLVRGVGPSLAPFGVTDAMPNPKISVMDGRGTLVAANEDWGSAGNAAGVTASTVGAFALPNNSRDAALVLTLSPGAYTLLVSGSGAADAGTVLAEVYDSRSGSNVSSARLINLSVRSLVGNSTPLLGGLVVSGTTSKRFLLRVPGPSLTAFGVVGAATDTQLDLFDSKSVIIRSNDNWDSGSAAETLELRQAITKAGAFPFSAGSRDAALVATLPPGLYTLRAGSVTAAGGVALIEVYELPD